MYNIFNIFIEILKKVFKFFLFLFCESGKQFNNVYLTATIDNILISKGKNMAIIARIDQKVVLNPGFTDSLGNPVTQFGSIPKWNVSDEALATLSVSEDGLTAIVNPTGKLGTVQISMAVDTDPGVGDTELIGTAEITFLSGKATIVTLSARVEDINGAGAPAATETPAPTDAPVVTEAPTQAPTATETPVPTEQATQEPTPEPTATVV